MAEPKPSAHHQQHQQIHWNKVHLIKYKLTILCMQEAMAWAFRPLPTKRNNRTNAVRAHTKICIEKQIFEFSERILVSYIMNDVDS